MRKLGLALTLPLFLAAAATAQEPVQSRPGRPLCGSVSVGPYAFYEYGVVQRACRGPVQRQYQARNAGTGFEALDLESEACFVPDEAYRLFDEIIDAVKGRAGAPPANMSGEEQAAYAITVSQTTDAVLLEMGFGQFSPTYSLGHALLRRSRPEEPPRYAIDGNAGALILLTVAQALNLPASLVAVTDNGAQRYFVRWGTEPAVDWDMAMHSQCDTRDDYAAYDGKPMTRDQVSSQLLVRRSYDWIAQSRFDKAVADSERAIALFPEHPVAYNNYVWLVATTMLPDRLSRLEIALRHADMLLSIERSPEYLDTAACIYALKGDFAKAAELEREAVKTLPYHEAMNERLKQFSGQSPRDCTGAS